MTIRLLHILIAINLMVSSLGVPVYEHACRKNGTTKVGFYFKPKSCCSTKKSICYANKVCNDNKNKGQSSKLSKKACCEDISHFIKATTLGIKQIGVSLWKQLNHEKSISSITTFGLVNTFSFTTRISFQFYHPPQIIKDIIQMIRVYRC